VALVLVGVEVCDLEGKTLRDGHLPRVVARAVVGDVTVPQRVRVLDECGTDPPRAIVDNLR
jgi:hypothetical protein